jgi:hypothetical protein
MNENSTTNTAQERFTMAVRNYVPRMAVKLQKLVPFQEGIADLRRRNASYETIADILCDADVKVSRFIVARFCREVLDLTPSRRKSSKATRRVPEQVLSDQPQADRASATKNSKKHGESKTAGLRVTREENMNGPRVADPNNI